MIKLACAWLVVASMAVQDSEKAPTVLSGRKYDQDRMAELERKILNARDPEELKGFLQERDRLRNEHSRFAIPVEPRATVVLQDPMETKKAELMAQMEDVRASLAAAGNERDALVLKTRLAELQVQVAQLQRERQLVIATRQYSNLQEAWHADPRVAELEHESRKLGDELRRLGGGDAEKNAELKKKLAGVLEKLFEVREEGRWKELEDLEVRMKEMRQTLEARKQNKARIVEKRMKELSGEKDDMDW